jgi:hypothetical protein
MILNQMRQFGSSLRRCTASVWRQFSSKGGENDFGIKFDEEQIRKKISQIK